MHGPQGRNLELSDSLPPTPVPGRLKSYFTERTLPMAHLIPTVSKMPFLKSCLPSDAPPFPVRKGDQARLDSSPPGLAGHLLEQPSSLTQTAPPEGGREGCGGLLAAGRMMLGGGCLEALASHPASLRGQGCGVWM